MEFDIVIPVLIAFAVSVVLGPVVIPFLLFYRRKDSYIPDASAKRKQVYLVFSGICSGRKSADSGALYHSQSSGYLLWRDYSGAGDPKHF